jgi:hypothetical protein
MGCQPIWLPKLPIFSANGTIFTGSLTFVAIFLTSQNCVKKEGGDGRFFKIMEEGAKSKRRNDPM